LAKSLSVPRVIVPPLPGALSALGILVSDVVKDYSRTVLWSVSGRLPIDKLEREFAVLRRSAETTLHDEGWKGAIQYQRSVDIRYRGQGHELNIPYSRGLVEDFRREHQSRYGYRYPERGVELVTLRLRAKVKSESGLSSSRVRIDPPPARSTTRIRVDIASVSFHGAKLKTAIRAREELQPGKKYHGPAVITEYSATTVVSPGLPFSLDKAGNLVIQIK
jgi:N-methylhydantoinase A